jgi:SAM-dependent methyltransferase
LITFKIPNRGDLEIVCTACHGALLTGHEKGDLSCSHCGKKFTIKDPGTFDFITTEYSSSSKFGLANQLFDVKYGEHIYSYWVTAKHNLQRLLKAEDKIIGLEKEIMGKVVLDVGCGPDLDCQSTEYPHVTPCFYVGVDYSSSFVRRASLKHSSDVHKFVRASATQLPFRESSFHITLALFTIHHVVGDALQVIQELARTASEKVIIFDHLKSTNKLKAGVQMAYWRIFDGGEQYLTISEWQKNFDLAGLVIERIETSGIFFSHVVKIVLKKT